MAFFDFLHIFTDLFNETERAWHKLEPAVQKALLHGSGVINIINQNLQATPDIVFELITKAFPDLTKENLTIALAHAATDLKVAEDMADPDVLTSIKNIQTYLAGKQGKFWQAASSTLSQLLTIALTPGETPFAKVATFIEWVYRKFFQH